LASVEYDPTCNALYIRLKRGKAVESELLSDNSILNLNRKKEIIGIEMLDPTPIDVKRFSTPIKVISRKPSSKK